MSTKTNFVETNELSKNLALSITAPSLGGISLIQKQAAAQFALASELSLTIRSVANNGVEETRETLVIKSKKENAVVSSRPLPEAVQTLSMEKRKLSRAERSVAETNVTFTAPQTIQYEATTDLPVIYAMNYHFIQNYSYFDSTIQLEDGSVWQLAPGDIYGVPTWWADDILIVSPNHDYHPLFNPYKYCITNQRTGTFALANISVGPDIFSPYMHRVLAVDYLFGRVYLDDGSYWEVDDEDYYLLQYWNAGDVIIVGDNDSDFFYETILINVTVNEYVRAEDV